MRTETLLKGILIVLLVGLTAVVTSWVMSEVSVVQAQGGGGAEAGQWIIVASELNAGNGLIYMFNTDKQVLLVYSYNRSRSRASGNSFAGDLQFLAGRHCRWDLLYSQLVPFPYNPGDREPSGTVLPAAMKKAFEKVSEDQR